MPPTDPLALAPLVTIEASLGPIVSVGRTPRGHVRMVAILAGTFEGPEARGRILPGGADWQEVRPDGVLEIRAHYLLETDAGEAIEVHSEGLRAAAPEVLARIERGEIVSPGEYYFRTAIRLTTASARLARYNSLLAVARGERRAKSVVISVFEVL
ncbi:MAG TPA: DUF3237 domain-containing protein [Polyangiaceae bacterium]|nr:DUF3237 domain-containing protein [Polyangiaceae bacterium]